MQAILTFTLVPVNAGLSLSPYIAACKRILLDSGLTCEFHANGTNVEGEWDTAFEMIKQCQEKVHSMGADRVFTTIQVSTRTDKEQQMKDKIKSVDSYLIK